MTHSDVINMLFIRCPHKFHGGKEVFDPQVPLLKITSGTLAKIRTPSLLPSSCGRMRAFTKVNRERPQLPHYK